MGNLVNKGDEVSVTFTGTAMGSTRDGSEQIRIQDSHGRTHDVYVSSISRLNVVKVTKPATPPAKVGDVFRDSNGWHTFDYVVMDRGEGLRVTCISSTGSRSVRSPWTVGDFFRNHPNARKVSSTS